MTARFSDSDPSSYQFGDNACDALYFGDNLIWTSFIEYDPVVITTIAGTIYSAPEWWRYGIDYLDYIILGGGAGGNGDTFGTVGRGGDGGSYTVGTTQTPNSAQLPAVRGYRGLGGAGVTGNSTGKNGETSYLREVSTNNNIASAAGGQGYSGTGSTQGKSPGNKTYEGMTVTGGAQQNTNGAAGNSPGGGGAGGGGFQSGGQGAPGVVVIQWRQNRDVH